MTVNDELSNEIAKINPGNKQVYLLQTSSNDNPPVDKIFIAQSIVALDDRISEIGEMDVLNLKKMPWLYVENDCPGIDYYLVDVNPISGGTGAGDIYILKACNLFNAADVINNILILKNRDQEIAAIQKFTDLDVII